MIYDNTLLFQFHTGSIKKARNRIVNHLNAEFQFHTGSIKNSIKSFGLNRRWCFNSTLVQLKIEPDVVNRRVSAEFQFHTGSIKKAKAR